jgi:hypothetical protein
LGQVRIVPLTCSRGSPESAKDGLLLVRCNCPSGRQRYFGSQGQEGARSAPAAAPSGKAESKAASSAYASRHQAAEQRRRTRINERCGASGSVAAVPTRLIANALVRCEVSCARSRPQHCPRHGFRVQT